MELIAIWIATFMFLLSIRFGVLICPGKELRKIGLFQSDVPRLFSKSDVTWPSQGGAGVYQV